MKYRTYPVSQRARKPLVDFICEALEQQGCTILKHSSLKEAPFRIAFETKLGERMGILCYAFLATFTPTKNRPKDEHSFQVKYGDKKASELHEIYQDPYGLYTTLLCGINPEKGFFVGIDPVLHSPTKFFIRVEFKEENVQQILTKGWHAWERQRRKGGEPVEVVVGGTRESFLQYVRFERLAKGLDQGPRELLAEKIALASAPPQAPSQPAAPVAPLPPSAHPLARELALSETELMDLIASARRLKMAVRGWVAEEHLVRLLLQTDGVSDCERLEAERGADVSLRFRGSKPFTIECKNVLRETAADGSIRLDFQRTRAPKGDPCGRYYRPDEFHVIAACTHAVTEKWEFRYALPGSLDPHPKCKGRLSNNVRLDHRWTQDLEQILTQAAAAVGT